MKSTSSKIRLKDEVSRFWLGQRLERRKPVSGSANSAPMKYGADYHPGFQQIAFVDTETGDCGEQLLEHGERAEKFYREFATQGKKVRMGMEASG